MTDEEQDDWYLPWEQSELRPRDFADFQSEKCVACWDRIRFVAEIPRTRRIGLNDVEMPPARFLLCDFHAAKLSASDSLARIYPLKGPRSE